MAVGLVAVAAAATKPLAGVLHGERKMRGRWYGLPASVRLRLFRLRL